MSQRIHGIAIPPVVTKYGAPMGRAEWGRPEDCPARGVHLFHVPLDSGGYDRGGAYWGHGQRLYCAYGHEPQQAGGVAIRTVREILPVGRAKDTEVWTVEQDDGSHCCCEDIFVKPDGSIWSCGCRHTQIGDLFGNHGLDGFDREYAHYGGRAPSALEDEQTVEEVVPLSLHN